MLVGGEADEAATAGPAIARAARSAELSQLWRKLVTLFPIASITNRSTSGVSEMILSDNGTAHQVKALVPAGSGQRFMHLKVTGLP